MIPDRAVNAARWRRARAIFDAIVDVDEAERADRLAQACGDLELRHEVESLLAYDRASNQSITAQLELFMTAAQKEMEAGALRWVKG